MSTKFAGIFETRKTKEAKPNKKNATVKEKSVVPKVGRPTGKRSDPNFEQVTAYLRKDTYKEVKIALIRNGEKQEFSELIEELLSQWLKTK